MYTRSGKRRKCKTIPGGVHEQCLRRSRKWKHGATRGGSARKKVVQEQGKGLAAKDGSGNSRKSRTRNSRRRGLSSPRRSRKRTRRLSLFVMSQMRIRRRRRCRTAQK